MANLVGIDLGTTNSAIALFDHTGSPRILANAQGEHMTPSAVYLPEGDIEHPLIGQAAKDYLMLHPERLFMDFKRQMDSHEPVKDASGATRSVDGVSLTAAALSTLVLRKVALDATAVVGPITEAVITVPANFANEARSATLAAGEEAGLVVKHIVNEPTAALFYYAYQKPITGTVMVYDFGGGTLDVTIAKVINGSVEIITSEGDPKLGGTDFDRKMEHLLRQKFLEASGTTYDERVHTFSKTPEEYKKQLTAQSQIQIQVTGGPSRVIFPLTRAEFESATNALITRADLLVESALDGAKMKPSDIADVYLVGGSSRMPMVHEHLRRTFGRPAVCHVNPDEVVALGAALYAGFKAKGQSLNAAQTSAVRPLSLKEVANHYFGTLSLETDPTGQRVPRNSIIIRKGEPLPCQRTETYFTVRPDQTAVDCQVTQSNTEEKDPEFVRKIFDGLLGPLPSGRPPGRPIRVTFSYDTNQLMHCVFEDVDSGIREDVNLNVSGDSEASDTSGARRFLIGDEE